MMKRYEVVVGQTCDVNCDKKMIKPDGNEIEIVEQTSVAACWKSSYLAWRR